jgi:hypothetical protein
VLGLPLRAAGRRPLTTHDGAARSSPRAAPTTEGADPPMATTSLPEYAAIHAAVCRYRRQGLVCSLCHELAERLASYARIAEAA